MALTEEQKIKIEEEESRKHINQDSTSNKQKSEKNIPWWKPKGKGAWLLALFFVTYFGLALVTPDSTNKSNSNSSTETDSQNTHSSFKEVNEIEIGGKKIKIGDSADSVYEIVTDKYKIDSPTIERWGKITHHFLYGKVLFDITVERNDTGGDYFLTKIVIKDNNYQIPKSQEQPPTPYQVGYSSGALATIAVPQGTTKNQLKDLLAYFHSLNERGMLDKITRGHPVISIFDDEKWTTEKNYRDIVLSKKYCNYIKATYSVDINGVERAGIGGLNCSDYEEIY